MADSQSFSLIIIERDSAMQADCGYETGTEMLKTSLIKKNMMTHNSYL
jgi:hypothetical protein